VDEYAQAIVAELLDELWGKAITQAVLVLGKAGEAIDDLLTWERIKDDGLRATLERHDNPTALIFQAIAGLTAQIEQDCREAQQKGPEALAAEVAASCELMRPRINLKANRGLMARLRSRPRIESRPTDATTAPATTDATTATPAHSEAIAEIESLKQELATTQAKLDEAQALLDEQYERFLSDTDNTTTNTTDTPTTPDQGEALAQDVVEVEPAQDEATVEAPGEVAEDADEVEAIEAPALTPAMSAPPLMSPATLDAAEVPEATPSPLDRLKGALAADRAERRSKPAKARARRRANESRKTRGRS
jgi:hypothetical protein